MRTVTEELHPVLTKKRWTDFYGIGKLVHKGNNIILMDCGAPTARITDGRFELILLHPETELEFDLIRDFAWQNGFKEINYMKPAELRKRYGVMPPERRTKC